MSHALCGNLDELQRLLDDELAPEPAAAIIAHVQGCQPCQRLLERIVTRPIGTPCNPDTPGGDETTDVTAPPSATEDDNQAEPSPEPKLEATDQEVQDPDRTMSRKGQDNPPTQDRSESTSPTYRPTIPGYELLEKLGEGGMGVVYLARQTGLNRLVAVKMIRGGQQALPEHFARFRIEAEAVAQLRHPNIIQIYEIGSVEDLPFVSLELLQRGSLASRLDGRVYASQ